MFFIVPDSMCDLNVREKWRLLGIGGYFEREPGAFESGVCSIGES
jgi:hypothetical protein